MTEGCGGRSEAGTTSDDRTRTAKPSAGTAIRSDRGWWLVAGGWWLVVGGLNWWLVAGGWWLVVGGWWLVGKRICRRSAPAIHIHQPPVTSHQSQIGRA